MSTPLFELSTNEADIVAEGLAKRVQEERDRAGGKDNALTANLRLQAERFAARARAPEPIVIGNDRDLAIVHLGFTAMPDEATREVIGVLEEALCTQTAMASGQPTEIA